MIKLHRHIPSCLPSGARIWHVLLALVVLATLCAFPPISTFMVTDAEAANLQRGDVTRAESKGIVLDSNLHSKIPQFDVAVSTTTEKNKETPDTVHTYYYALAVPANGNATLGRTISVRWDDVGFDADDDRIDLVLSWLPDSKWYAASKISRVPLLVRYDQNGYHTAGISIGLDSLTTGGKACCEEHIRIMLYKHGTTQPANGSFLTKITDLDKQGWDGGYGDRWCESIEFISGHGQDIFIPDGNILNIGKNRNGENATDFRATHSMDGSSLDSGLVASLSPSAEFWYYSTRGWTDILDQFDPKTINLTAGSGGRVHCSGKNDRVPVGWRGERTVSIEPDTGYRIEQVLVDGSSVGTPGSYAFRDVTADHSLSASFVPISYVFRFHANGGAGTMADISLRYDETKTLTPNSFSRPGYRFTGWNTSPDGGGSAYQNAQEVRNVITNDGAVIDLYAQWEPITYQVSFDAHGGEGAMEDQRFTFDQTQVLSFNRFARTGYLFAGWNRDPSGNGTPYLNEQEVKNLAQNEGETVKLYAQWQPIWYFVAFEPHGGEGAMDAQRFTFDQLEALSQNTFTKEGFHWFKWNSSPSVPETWFDDGELVKNLADRANEVVSLYAIWCANRCLIVFDKNGGSGSMEAQSLAYDTAEHLHPNQFEKDGARWISWNTAPDGTGISYEDEALVENLSTIDNSTIMLYAQWENDEPNTPEDPEDPEEPPADDPAEDEQKPPADDTSAPPAPPAEEDPEPSPAEDDVVPPVKQDPPASVGADANFSADSDEAPTSSESDEEADAGPSKATKSDTAAVTSNPSSPAKTSHEPFDKTGAGVIAIIIGAFAALVGGCAFVIAGTRRRKRALERRREIFRSFLDS